MANASPPSATRRSDRLIFSLAGAWFLVLTFVGFAPTFFLRTLPDPLPTHQVVHGIVSSAWVVLFLVQALLIASHRVRWHMTLGAAAVVLLIVMIPTGFHVVLVKTAANLKSIDEAGFNLTQLTLGFAFAFAGIANRNRPYVHKRLMLFATLMLTVAAADRVPFTLGFDDDVRLLRKGLALAPGMALVACDGFVSRRVPLLSASLLALAVLVNWFLISDLVFAHAAGQAIIQFLTRLFVW